LIRTIFHKASALHQYTELSDSAIANNIGTSRHFVQTWKDKTQFLDAPRSGAPITALTDDVLLKLAGYEVTLLFSF